MKVAVFIIKEDSLDKVRYFINELKEQSLEKGLRGRFRVTSRMRKSLVNGADYILFKFNNYYIAKAKLLDKTKDYPLVIDDKIRAKWKYLYPECKGDIYDKYYYEFSDILDIPPIEDSILNKECFRDDNSKQYGMGIKAYQVKNEEVFLKYLNRKVDRSIFRDKIFKKIPYSLLSQINYYNIENIHTNFLANFIDRNNVFSYQELPLKNFINLIDKDFKGDINSLEIHLQKKYDNKFQPDIVIENDDVRYIIEMKLYAYENEYKDTQDKQGIRYEEYFNKLGDKKKNKCIFITVRDDDLPYKVVLFKDLVDNVYLKEYNKGKNKVILEDYLKSFFYLAGRYRDIRYKYKMQFNIKDIPYIKNLNGITILDCKEFYKRNKNIIKNIMDNRWAFRDITDNKYEVYLNMIRYICVILYNENVAREEVEKLYNYIYDN